MSPAAVDVSRYSATERLRDGRRAEIRALARKDRTDLLDAVSRMSPDSRRTRFFGPKQSFSDAEIEYFTNIDFVDHVALVVSLEEQGVPLIVGGGRYIVTRPGRAELAFAVDDAHQGLGIASALLRHLVGIARTAALEELYAEVLPENWSMLKVFRNLGDEVAIARGAEAVHVSLRLR